MRIPLLVGAALLLSHTTVAHAAPAWCSGEFDSDKPTGDFKDLIKETDPWRALENLVGSTCYPDREHGAADAPQVEKIRGAWSKKLGLTEADWKDVALWAHLPRYLRSGDSITNPHDQAWSTLGPIDQYDALGHTGSVDTIYVADAIGAKLTETGRVSFVKTCMQQVNQPSAPVWYAACSADVDALDPTKLYAELSADKKYDAGTRVRIRVSAYETLQKLPAFRTEMQALRAKDPAYDKMFELAKDAQTQWGTIDPKLVALMADLDDAHVTGSRKASSGCMDRVEAAWASAVRAVPVKTLAAIKGEAGKTFVTQMLPYVTGTPNGYLAALALNVCASLEEQEDALTRAIGYSLYRFSGNRGPRSGAVTQILSANLKLDKRDARVEFPEIRREFIKGDGNSSFIGTAAITTVKVEGDKATITFAKQKVRQTRCVSGHYTNRVQRIADNGQFMYEYQCDKYIDETIMVEPNDPQKVRAKYAKGLSAGMSVTLDQDVVSAAYPKNSGTPSIVAGVVLK